MERLDVLQWAAIVLIGIAASYNLIFQEKCDCKLQESVIYDNKTPVRQEITTVVHNETGIPAVKIFERVEPSLVSIEVRSGSTAGGYAQGSGFVYDKQGRIVTNAHVVGNSAKATVAFLDGSVAEGMVIGKDEYSDLAVIDVDLPRSKLKPLILGNSSALRVGEPVYTVGNPFGLSGSMTAGIVSQLNRKISSQQDFVIPNVIQTDAAVNPGNSGGPLLNQKAKVVGVNTAISSRTGTFSGVGFSIPADTVERIVGSLIKKGEYKHPWIGVSGRDLTPEIAQLMDLNTTKGFLVVDVVKDSPADKAGLRASERKVTLEGIETEVGGDVVVEIGDKRVRKIDDVLNYLASETEVGDHIALTVIRNHQRKRVSLTLEERPEPGS